ncbi:hypothetical protein, partial [Collinsella tanakaei]|uniref:hypothetical protein n=1 Tax=Collinsella tanakaei TaxID=626935 RepID=UPI00195E67C7
SVAQAPHLAVQSLGAARKARALGFRGNLRRLGKPSPLSSVAQAPHLAVQSLGAARKARALGFRGNLRRLG